jgi:selenide,water dikinase
LPRPALDPNLLVGTETCDDAGVYRLDDRTALVQTVDFFPPLVDDPYRFGQIAAANSLSDVYAMNGRPLTALNVAGFPDDQLDLGILGRVLAGAAERVAAAGAVTVGGHTVRDSEVKFGLSVTGLVDPAEITTNAGARAGDLLVLTKPLGTGLVTTAAKKENCPPDVLEGAIASMVQLNAIARDAFRAAGGAHAVTDVTGFGLAGHASEMAEGSGLTLVLETAKLPRIAGAEALAVPRFHSRASKTNRTFLEGRSRIEASADPIGLEFAYDPQTSGGLLIAVAPEYASRLVEGLRQRHAGAWAIVGEVVPREGDIAIVLR